MIENRLIDSLTPHPINEQIYGDTYDHELISSIKEYGFKGSIEITKDDVIVSGHRRWFVMQELEYETIPVTIVDIEDPDELISYLIRMNQSQRKRTNLQVAAEFEVLKEIEQRRAAQRKADAGGDKKSDNYKKSLVANLPQAIKAESNGKSRDKAAEKLNAGWSPKTAENALKVKKYSDEIKDTHPNIAEDLITILNDTSVNAAFIKMKLIKKTFKDDAKKQAEEEAQEKRNAEMGAQLEPTPVLKTEPVRATPVPIPTPKSEPVKPKTEDPKEFFNPNPPPEPALAPPVKKSKFNKTNENIEWAKWSWNPVTGCLHDCQYCYARDLAVRYNKGDFSPTFHANRLNAPQFTNIPAKRIDEPGIKNVFVCSMADLFGKWVDTEWIQTVIDVCREQSQWTYLFLTKNPERYLEFEFPKNCWLGASATNQNQFDRAIRTFYQLQTKCVKFLSCEPLNEKIEIRTEGFSDYFPCEDNMEPIDINLNGEYFNTNSELEKEMFYSIKNELECINWMIIGGRSESMRMPAFQPEWSWVEHLVSSAHLASVPIYFKPNLTVRPKNYPSK